MISVIFDHVDNNLLAGTLSAYTFKLNDINQTAEN